MKDLTLYIPTCNSYLFLVKPYTFLFNKFWNRPQKVVYLGYDKPKCDLPDNFDFITIGNDDDLKNWSSDLINFFSSIDDDHFLFSCDDILLVDYTNFEVYDKLLKYLDNPRVGRINVSRDTVNRPHKHFDTNEDLTIIEAKQSADYRVSMALSIWRRDYFLKNLKVGMTPWEFEGQGGEVGKNDGYHILGTKGDGPPDDAPVFTTNAIWRSNKERLNFHSSNYSHVNNGQNYLDPNVVKEMFDKNIIEDDIEVGWVYESRWYTYKGI
tara:strand:- start:522 stop:1322 length:801 start_codon:yes stop_codon:yes gene_type:complete